MAIPLNIVWFKRDLRIADHDALTAACNSGAVLPLFVWEPKVWVGNDYVAQHAGFITECLEELRLQLQLMGLSLVESSLGIVEVLNSIISQYPIAAIYSHEETGNDNTFAIDIAVTAWCKTHNITWIELPQNGVVRRLKSRNYWSRVWEKRMTSAQLVLPQQCFAAPQIDLPKVNTIQENGVDKLQRQHGGRSQGLVLLNSFLNGRAARYRGGISSPINAVTAGSRLSPYLAWGALSMREVVQTSRMQQRKIAENPQQYPRSLNAGIAGFESRLHWHCHFMQKLESEPALEFENLNHVHDGMRCEQLADNDSQKRLAAWSKGETGWPLVDACMAMLRATGWINFRMRAMLMSTASYLYWLHWRETGLHLAREFLDYEPGIHWSQAQMQSGTTGINTLRIYNPIKQAIDQDPEGKFVRHWLPSLKNVPTTWIFQPWLMPPSLQLQYGCIIERDYPAPLVNIEQALREARSKISSARSAKDYRQETASIIKKHASRKGMLGGVRDANGNEIKRKKVSSKTKEKRNSNNMSSKQQELF